MKNVSTLKSSKIESPKTPGGISKSLLTPCRRLGLSRNWKKAGPSPFISPLAGGSPSSVEVKVEKREPKKRKVLEESEEVDEKSKLNDDKKITNVDAADIDESCISASPIGKTDYLTDTPTRHVEIPHRKKSKTLFNALTGTGKANLTELVEEPRDTLPNESSSNVVTASPPVVPVVVLTQKSKSKSKKSPKQPKQENTPKFNKLDAQKEESKDYEPKTKSPNELTKECIVVIQKKIFKIDKKEKKTKESTKVNKNSQVLFDSDSDDVPLCQLNKENDVKQESTKNIEVIDNSNVSNTIELEDDFVDSKIKVKKLEDKATSIGDLKKKPKLKTVKTKPTIKPVLANNSDFDDEDDFDFTTKKTILIRKTYDKVNKPQKAKSTGSITQKDIDDLKARIEMKKKLLLAQAMTGDTEELRSLIKKWQKGCQDALIELMDLMKNKFPEKQNMDYSEMLSMLKIPTHLVGYDEENDCFTTPEDKNIILSKFND